MNSASLFQSARIWGAHGAERAFGAIASNPYVRRAALGAAVGGGIGAAVGSQIGMVGGGLGGGMPGAFRGGFRGAGRGFVAGAAAGAGIGVGQLLSGGRVAAGAARAYQGAAGLSARIMSGVVR